MSQVPLKLAGKVALITGAGSGIGAATAKLFTQLGATVAITGTTKSKLENTVNECLKVSVGQPQPLVIVGNIKDNDVRKKLIDDTVKTFGKLDTLVNNAGTYRLSALLQEGSLADFDELIDVNLSPGMIKTDIYTQIGLKPDAIKQVFAATEKLHVLGRLGESLEVANAIAFLASDDASFITGTDILVDGGILVNTLTQAVLSKN